MTRPLSEPVALPRELSEFLVELSIALHKHAIYPPTHPLLAGAAGGVSRTLGVLLTERPSISLGIARRQLIIDGVATDPHNSLLRELAERLHRHHLGALTFERGVSTDEVASFLHVVAGDADRKGPLGLRAPQAWSAWARIQVHPLKYAELELIDGERGAPTPAHSAQLWVGFASAALASAQAGGAQSHTVPLGQPGSGGSVGGEAEPSDLARAIDAHGREVAYDQVIVGYLLQIADELKRDAGGDTAALRTRVSKLVASLNPETLRQLLAMGGDAFQRRRFLRDAAETLTVDAVVELLRAAAQPGQNVSHSMLRMMRKLAAHATSPDDATRAEADAGVRENVRLLLDRWTLEDPNPDAYRGALEGMSRVLPEGHDQDGPVTCEPDRIIETAIEVGVVGGAVWRAVEAMTEARQLGALLDLVDQAPSGNIPAAAIAERAVSPERLQALLRDEAADGALVARVTRRLGAAACESLLDALEAEDSARARARIIELLASLGAETGAAVAERLPRSPVPLQRDLLALLAKLRALPAGLSLPSYVAHVDAGIRREAIKLMLHDPSLRDPALAIGIADADERTVLVVLGEALERCSAAVVGAVRRRVDRGGLEPPVGALAIRVVAAHGAGDTPVWLSALATGGKRRLFRPRLAAASPEVLAAIGGLAEHWAHDPRAAGALALALRSTDREVRGAVSRHRVRPATPTPADRGIASE